MQNWTPEMWQPALIGLVVGFVLAYLLLRFTKDSVKKQVKTEAELQKVKSELDQQKQHLEKHFSESADLLKTLAQDYQKLYQHLANSSAELLPQLENKPLFENKLIEQHQTEERTANEVEPEKTGSTDTVEQETVTNQPLKAEK
ncbi:YhcB family protein [Avibacterium paragallinarum]|uniref:YhcB family protein n=1 Tax=Avibacterium paragallinarum TaxID=728 RepID=UPI002ED8FB53